MDTNIFSALHQTLKEGKGSVLIRIIHREGSAPRGVGSSCLVAADGLLSGTIGGGLLEFRAIEKAKVLLVDRVTSFSTIEMSSKEIEDEGMICGGKVELFFEPIIPEDDSAVEFFGAIVELVEDGGSATLVTQLGDGKDALSAVTRMLIKKDGTVIGEIPGVEPPNHVNRAQLVTGTAIEYSLFLEPIKKRPEILLFGGGHISTFVAPIAKMIGLQVSVFDDRIDFANRERFPEADEIYAIPYREAFDKISITENSYVVIVTRGHGGDKEVLELVLNLGFSPAYIGMIGSVRKRDALYQAMIETGMSEDTLSRIHSPIGLDIGAQTPEEIAISIIAEIIQVKANRGKPKPSSGAESLYTIKEHFFCLS